MATNSQLFQLEVDEELRIEVECPPNEEEEGVTVELKQGMAEIFGTEMVLATVYKFKQGAKFSIFTFHGCSIKVCGKSEVHPYTSKETPMVMYLNVHAALEQMRKDCEERLEKEDKEHKDEDAPRKGGPVAMVVGPMDVGKSTVCRLLLNYAVRMGRRPVYVDLDMGQGSVSVPGSVGSVLVERPASVEEGFSQTAPLVYHFGHTSSGTNPLLFNKLVSGMADVVRERMATNRKVEASGAIINTCGWVRGEGYKQLTHIAQAFEVDVIIVLDQERVYNDLVRDMPDFVRTVWLPKSGGVVEKRQEQRAESRVQRVRQYFYGGGSTGPLFPHSFEIKFSELKDRIFKIGAPQLPDSCMPIGMKVEENQTKLVPVQPSNSRELLNRLLALSYADKKEDLIITNVAGFICVTDVNVKEEKLTVLSPQPRPLPKMYLLVSEVQFVDGQ